VYSRRTFLGRAVLGGGVIASAAGCIGDAGETDAVGELDTEFTDPGSTVPPRFYAGYDVAVQEVTDRPTLSSIVPTVAETFLDRILASVSGVDTGDLDRITGSRYRKTALSGGKLRIPRPQGQSMHVSGSFDAEPLLGWLRESDLEELSPAEGYKQFGRTNSKQYEAFAVTDGRVLYGTREEVETDPESILEAERRAVAGEADGSGTFAPDFYRVFDALDDASFRAGVAFAHLPLAADTGVEAFDETIPGLVGAGVGAKLQGEGAIQRELRYLEDGAVSPETVRRAFAAGADGDGPIAEPDVDWSITAEGQQLTARTTVDAETIRDDPAFLTSALPSPGYERLYGPVNPSKIGQRGTPQVALSAGLDDGHVTLEFLGGRPETDIKVRYVHAGESRHETWELPLEEGDQFRSQQTVDADTEAWVVGRPDTVDASIIIRLQA